MDGWMPVHVQRTEKHGEQECDALLPLEGKGHDDVLHLTWPPGSLSTFTFLALLCGNNK